jgi:hypothetical protein
MEQDASVMDICVCFPGFPGFGVGFVAPDSDAGSIIPGFDIGQFSKGNPLEDPAPPEDIKVFSINANGFAKEV